ncbi:MAG: hypothetical protein MHMPM18_004951, partial [Marteilia pararefringens]
MKQQKWDEELVKILENKLIDYRNKCWKCLADKRLQRLSDMIKCFESFNFSNMVCNFLKFSSEMLDSFKTEMDERNEILISIISNREPKKTHSVLANNLYNSHSKISLFDTNLEFDKLRKNVERYFSQLLEIRDFQLSDSTDVVELQSKNKIEEIFQYFEEILNQRIKTWSDELKEK